MCKIAAFSGIKPSKIKEAWLLAKELAPYMTQHDDDGFGYAAMTKDGTLMVERWLDTELAFKYKEDNKADKEIVESMGDALSPLESGYSSEGKVDKTSRGKAVAIILHARWATCEKGLKNVHPFVENGTALIHNGVISNNIQLMNKYDTENTKKTTCDSEALVYSYTKNEIISNPSAIQVLGTETSGYYACAVLTKGANGIPTMDIFKSASAQLFGTYVPQIGCFVYCTSDDILKNAIRTCGFTWQRMFKIKEGNLIRHNAITGKSSVVSKFEERSYSSYPSGKSYYKGMYDDDSEYGRVGSIEKHNGGSTYYPSTGTVIDATTGDTKIVEYDSWEQYQKAKYDKVITGPSISEQANASILADLNKKRSNVTALPSENDMPNFIRKLPFAKQDVAFDDYVEIMERHSDFKLQGRM